MSTLSAGSTWSLALPLALVTTFLVVVMRQQRDLGHYIKIPSVVLRPKLLHYKHQHVLHQLLQDQHQQQHDPQLPSLHLSTPIFQLFNTHQQATCASLPSSLLPWAWPPWPSPLQLLLLSKYLEAPLCRTDFDLESGIPSTISHLCMVMPATTIRTSAPVPVALCTRTTRWSLLCR